MAKTNVKATAFTPGLTTHQGGPAVRLNTEAELRRAVLSCLLWEDTFYEDGESIAKRITALAAKVPASRVLALATEARTKYRLRHASLWLLLAAIRNGAQGSAVGQAVADTIQRADELSEFLALYWEDGKTPISKQVKRGLAMAFQKFDAYQLAKYDRANTVRLRDVLFLVHAKPKTAAQAATWKQLIDGTLPSPETWEVKLSAIGQNKEATSEEKSLGKKEAFENLLRSNKMGYLALLRNLRNMHTVGCDYDLVASAVKAGAAKSKALPFRFLAAANAAPQFTASLDDAMLQACSAMDKLPGTTAVVVDISGSMRAPLSNKSELTRVDAACALAILAREVSDNCRVFAYASDAEEVQAYRGLALKAAIQKKSVGSSTYLGKAMNFINATTYYDRVIVITDEQSADKVPAPKGKGYVINVASYLNGISHGAWTNITGFSEAVIDYIREIEAVGRES